MEELDERRARELLQSSGRPALRQYLEGCKASAEDVSDKFLVWAALFLFDELEAAEAKCVELREQLRTSPYR